MSSLFDEDSSSDEELTKAQPNPIKQRVIDDDDNEGEKKQATDDDDDDDTPKRTIEVDEDDDDDDNDSVPAKKYPTKEKSADDDDDDNSNEVNKDNAGEEAKKKVVYHPDEEDVEFDDDGQIVGSAAPIKVASGAPKISNKRPTKMTVMESTRSPKGTTLHITKLPNLVGIQPEAFNEEEYSPELEEREYNGYVHNMIRWRYTKDLNGNFVRNVAGKLKRESNSRLVKWDDGSMTLHVGSEVLAVDSLNTTPGEYPGLNGYLYLSQKATFPTDKIDEEEQAGGTVLECMGAMTSKLTARPSSLQSEAHKALTVAVRQKTVRRAKIAEYVTQEDPEKMKEEKIRQKTDLNKAEARKSGGRSYGGRSARTPGMNRRYMEDEDNGNYDSVNIRQLKNRQFDNDEMDYGDDDSEDDDEDDVGWSKGKLAAMRANKKRQREVEDDDEEEEFGAGNDSDEEVVTRVNKPAKKRQTNLFDDDDD